MNSLEGLARHLLMTGAPDAKRALLEALRDVSEPATIRELAEAFYAEPEVSVPAFQRLLELSPRDVAAWVELGFVFFLIGDDEEARRQLGIARSLDPEHVQVLTLEAALAREPLEKILLYRRILQQEPRNAVALGKLRELGAVP